MNCTYLRTWGTTILPGYSFNCNSYLIFSKDTIKSATFLNIRVRPIYSLDMTALAASSEKLFNQTSIFH